SHLAITNSEDASASKNDEAGEEDTQASSAEPIVHSQKDEHRTPLIAIVGRPNVGKSRLFNRMTRSHFAIVGDHAGITRDRQYGEGSWNDRPFQVVDTGGFEPESTDDLLRQMREQAQI